MTIRGFLTDEVPAIGGRVRAEPADFLVEEELLYEPCGEGTHSWLRIEKSGVTTFEVIRRLARALGRREDDFGHAGLKDRHAVARQTLTLEHADPAALAALAVPGVRVLEVTHHRNKLRVGHLRGNRFTIRVRGTDDGDADRALRALAILGRRGVPNWFGEQRFGREGATPRLGRLLLADDFAGFLRAFAVGSVDVDAATASPAELAAAARGDALVTRALRLWAERGRPDVAVRVLPRRFLTLCTSALQSAVFNRVLEERLATIDEVTEGDVAYLHRNGACFVVDDVTAAQPRAAAFEISPSAPMPGPFCLAAAGAQLALETRILAELDVQPGLFAVRRPYAQKGGRRPLRVPLGGPSVVEEAEGPRRDLVLSFELPAGSYATAVLAELFKAPAATRTGADDLESD